jgi:hypothetical protein
VLVKQLFEEVKISPAKEEIKRLPTQVAEEESKTP